MLQGYIEEREGRVALIESMKTAAREANRDLSDQDMETITKARERIEVIDRQLQFVSVNDALNEDIAARIAVSHPGSVSAPFAGYRSIGEAVWDRLHAREDAGARDRYGKMMTRAAQHMGTVAADTTATAGDLAGLVVNPVVGPMINFTDASRPFISAIGPRQVNAYDFNRPYISDGAAATGTAKQTAQKAELASTAFSVLTDPLEYATYGEYLNVSQQLLTFQPTGLTIIADQLRRRVARGQEKAAFTELALSTSKVTLSLTAVDNTVNAAIEDGIAKVYDETGMPAEWILMGPTGRARLGKVVDSAGRPLYPYLSPSNANGTINGDVNGLRPIISYAVTTAAMWIGNSSAFEVYEQLLPLMDVAEPSVLGRQIAVGSMMAFYRTRSKSGQLGPVQLAP